MYDSNIVVESNVVFCKTDIPEHDSTFLHQIQDAAKLKKICDAKLIDRGIPRFSEEQEEILRNEMRCEYALNDPCWGYSLDKKKVVCACINKKCKLINQCNPNYSDHDAKNWVKSRADILLYGDPEKLPRYYFVDMIPDDEMQRYYSDPKNEGIEFCIVKNVVLDDVPNEEKFRIDPHTGKKQIVVGYRWKLDNIGSYEGEDLIPIWGYVDEVFEEKRVARKKAKRIEKIANVGGDSKTDISSLIVGGDERIESPYRTEIKNRIKGDIKLTELSEEAISNGRYIITVSNIAERAYISSMLLLNGITHSFSQEDDISVMLLNEYTESYKGYTVFISDTLLKNDFEDVSVDSLKALSSSKLLVRLEVPYRDYFEFVNDKTRRWCCRNIYGVTHIVVEEDDILEFKRSDGEYDVSISVVGNEYSITGLGGKIFGKMKASFASIVDELIATNNIDNKPDYIKGLRIVKGNGKMTILGMGNMKFSEY